MISIKDNSKCSGCSACASICPQRCISMIPDNEGFLYPLVNKENCINCNLCEKVCHELNPYDARIPQQVWAAINKDTAVRSKSSSGGIFYLLAESVLSFGGKVYGIRYDKNWQASIACEGTLLGVEKFLGSKYVQANVNSSYIQCRDDLKKGELVLYSGTPCQIAGLKHYLRKDYENLITVDVVCHGVPSPLVWARYVDYIKASNEYEINDIRFRDKTKFGWKRFCLVFNLESQNRNEDLTIPLDKDPYMRAFLNDLILRPSCYNCKAKCGKSGSDITLADYWGVEKYHPEFNDNKGTSLVFINTEKGKSILDETKLCYVESSYSYAVKENPAIIKSTIEHINRKRFFKLLQERNDLVSHIEKELPLTFVQRVLMKCGRHFRNLYSFLLRIYNSLII